MFCIAQDGLETIQGEMRRLQPRRIIVSTQYPCHGSLIGYIHAENTDITAGACKFEVTFMCDLPVAFFITVYAARALGIIELHGFKRGSVLFRRIYAQMLFFYYI
jgi:hypothetical protein